MTTAYRLMANEFSNAPTFDRGLLSAQQHASPQYRTLELTSVLQTTLDLGELMGLFFHELRNHVELDGLCYYYQEKNLEVMKGETARNQLSYKLTIADDNFGKILFFRKHPFREADTQTLEDLLLALLYPLRNTLTYREALRSALIDPLTGVNNRAAMDMGLHRELELARRQTTALSIILLDVDHFKQVNDSYGHPAGDVALQAIASCVIDSIRGSDMLFRCGGEEFMVLLSQIKGDGAKHLAERIRENVKILSLPAVKGKSLSVSLGVTELTSKDTVSSLYSRADQALYRAKRGGRDRVELL